MAHPPGFLEKELKRAASETTLRLEGIRTRLAPLLSASDKKATQLDTILVELMASEEDGGKARLYHRVKVGEGQGAPGRSNPGRARRRVPGPHGPEAPCRHRDLRRPRRPVAEPPLPRPARGDAGPRAAPRHHRPGRQGAALSHRPHRARGASKSRSSSRGRNTSGRLEYVHVGEGVEERTWQLVYGAGTTWSGEVSGTVSRSFDDDFRISRWTVAGASITHSFDLDGLLTRAGDLAISRSATTGFITGTSLGTVTTDVGRNDFGELDHLSASTGSSQLYGLSFERDKLGRIIHKTETVGGVVETYDYGRSYQYVTDQVGSVRLIVDTVDGSIAQRVDYDPFGRAFLDSNPGFQPFGFAGGLVDQHTYLVRFGARDYDPDGTLKQATTYDEFGNRIRQYDLGETTRHGEGYHTFDYDATHPRQTPGGGTRGNHQPFD